MIKSLSISIFMVIILLQTCYAQFNSIEIDKEQRIILMEISPSDFNNWISLDEFSDFSKITMLTAKIYEKFKDDFDFIVLISNQENVPENFPYYGMFRMVSNDVEGIGLQLYSNASLFGSAGKLKGVLHLPYKHGILYGPFLHELMHCWANYALPTDVEGHWGFMGGNVRAQLGGFLQSSLQKNVNGNPTLYSVETFGPFANGGNGVPYSELELYMMGLIPISKVSNFDMLKGIRNTVLDNTDNLKLIIEADSCINYTPEKIISLMGDRIPSWQLSQKSFKTLFVIISANKLSAEEGEYFNKQVVEFCRPESDSYDWLYNFWEATGGMAVLDADSLNNSLKETYTSVADNEQKSSLLLYPNPVVDQLNIVTDVDMERIRIYNTANQLILNLNVNSRSITVPTRMFPSGVYLISIDCKNRIETRKIIVK